MSEFRECKVKIVVESSKCHLYEAGDEIYLDGAVLNIEKSVNVCLTAINAFYPFIYAARKGVTAEQMGFDELTFQCPDYPETVKFTIVQYEDEE